MSYRLTKRGKYRFLIWLADNKLTLRKFAIKTGYSYTYINSIVNGKINITPKIQDLFRKFGYKVI